MTLYETSRGDRIDLIVLNHYGDLTHLNDVLSENPYLSKKSMSLKFGVEIKLPDFVTGRPGTKSVTDQLERKPLW